MKIEQQQVESVEIREGTKTDQDDREHLHKVEVWPMMTGSAWNSGEAKNAWQATPRADMERGPW